MKVEVTDNLLDLFSHVRTSQEAYEIIEHLNGTMPDLACKLMEKILVPNGYCEPDFDKLICWPTTKANSLRVLPCLAEINGIEYDITKNVSRWCNSNGTWDYTNYSECREINVEDFEQEDIVPTIYFVGYITSLLALSAAVFIFLYFKDLRCLRNVIHTNLMCTYILTAFLWILTLILQMTTDTNFTTCVFLMILLHYSHLTNFFWMFVEGLYLYILVVETFHGENIGLRIYISIGWGCPIVFILLWAVVKTFASGETSEFDSVIWKKCPWMQPHTYDWIYQAPAIGILLVNLVFLFAIMWVLITKLRSAQTVETQQYRKAAKALLVLIPLLGITYVLVIAGPTHGVYKNIHDIIRAVLISTQGFTVALFYCFLNSEVQNTLRHHKERWKVVQSFRSSRRPTYCSRSNSKDLSGSPRSRTESMRLFNAPPIYRKRESLTASEITTTTFVNVNNTGVSSRLIANGTPIQIRTSPFLQHDSSDNV